MRGNPHRKPHQSKQKRNGISKHPCTRMAESPPPTATPWTSPILLFYSNGQIHSWADARLNNAEHDVSVWCGGCLQVESSRADATRQHQLEQFISTCQTVLSRVFLICHYSSLFPFGILFVFLRMRKSCFLYLFIYLFLRMRKPCFLYLFIYLFIYSCGWESHVSFIYGTTGFISEQTIRWGFRR